MWGFGDDDRPAPPRVVLGAERIVKVFEDGPRRVNALRGVSLALAEGEVLALEGPSGSGKTTLLSILGCILSPSSGRVTVGGEVVDGEDPELLRDVRRRLIGFVFQQFNLFPALTALENVEYALNVKGVRGRRAREAAAQALDLVGLSDRSRFLPRDLSGGQQQRVAIARAIAPSPPVLLADEPTANLDGDTGAQILELFHRLARRARAGLLIVSHDRRVRATADRVLEIRDGRLLGQVAAPRGEGRASRPAGFVEGES
jgi:putative ABC transport system ATP-binding protein